MANQLYKNIKEDFLSGSINLSTASVKVALVKSGYVIDIDNDQYLSDIGSSNIAATSNALTSITITDGVFDAENETIAEYGTEGFDYLVIFEDTGISNTSRLIAYIDTGDGLPVNSSNGTISITIQWSDLVSKIFAL